MSGEVEIAEIENSTLEQLGNPFLFIVCTKWLIPITICLNYIQEALCSMYYRIEERIYHY